jgi:hypothetical protein
LVLQDNLTGLTISSKVISLANVGVNPHDTACGRSSCPREHPSALYPTASRAFKGVVLKAPHHHGGVPDDLHQAHSCAAVDATHNFIPPFFIYFLGADGMKWANFGLFTACFPVAARWKRRRIANLERQAAV